MAEAPEQPNHRETLKKAFLKLDELQRKLGAAEAAARQPIAIVGVGCRFPGGVHSLEGYWQLLSEGRNAITDVPSDRWDVDRLYDPNPEAVGKMYSTKGGFLDAVDQFDAAFFGISPREVLHMDPQQRLLLEVTWEALERAGIAPATLVDSKTGVFTGIGFNDYSRILGKLSYSEMNAYTGPGTQVCFASGRVSYTLGLRGPSVPIDTACSSSLVAIHQGCQSLRSRESDLVLAGGVNLVLVPEGNIWLSRAGALAPDGRCKTFDAAANGFVRGEGCAVLVLKRLDEAIRDGNVIFAVLRGSAVNHDGRSSGLTVPSGPAQEALLRQALSNAGLEPNDVDYVEAHGTGTSLGDPIEMQALLAVLGGEGGSRSTPLVVGSVKTNLGHLEAASGVASVVKVITLLQQRQIAPHLHFSALNPMISANDAQVKIPTELQPWPGNGSKRRIAGVSSFGLSGTNAHVLLEEAPERRDDAPSPESTPPRQQVLPLSAAKPEALRALAAAYAERLSRSDVPFQDVCFTAAVGRDHLDHRLAVTAATAPECVRALTAYLDKQSADAVRVGRRPLTGTPKLAFVFGGAEFIDPSELRTLTFQEESEFRETFEHCDAAFQTHGHPSLTSWLNGGADPSHATALDRHHSHRLAFTTQVAAAALWRSWGIEPDAVMGLAGGEVAAAHVSEALSLDDAVTLVHHHELLSPIVGQSWGQKGQAGRQLADFIRTLARLRPAVGTIPFCSTVTGQLTEGTQLDSNYWKRNLARPTDLDTAMQTLGKEGFSVFLDLSCARALEQARFSGSVTLSVASGESARQGMLSTLARLYCQGFSPTWREVLGDGKLDATLPTYPWQRQRYWVDQAAPAKPVEPTGRVHPLLGHEKQAPAAQPDTRFWEMEWGPGCRSFATLQQVAGRRVASTATFANLALAASREVFGDAFSAVTDLAIHQPLVLSEDDRPTLQVSVSSTPRGPQMFHVHSRPSTTDPADAGWVLHASAELGRT